MMRIIVCIGIICIVFGCKPSQYVQRNEIKLAPPQVEISNVFFDYETIILPASTEKGAKLKYSTGDGEKKKLKKSISLKESSVVLIQTVGGGFMESDITTVEVVKVPGLKNNSISSERPLDPNYGAEGLDILIDVQNGDKDFRKGWLGYSGGTVKFRIEFDEREVGKTVISTLRNQGSWIFSPKEINVYSSGKLVYSHTITSAIDKENDKTVFSTISFPKVMTDHLTIELIAPSEIPDWHPGKGNPPWMFIDEILIY